MLNKIGRLFLPLVIGLASAWLLALLLGTNSKTTPVSLAQSLAEPDAPGACYTTTWTFLTRTLTSDHFRIHYTLDGTNYPAHALKTVTQTTILSADLEATWDIYQSYGFNTPTLNGDGYIEVYVYNGPGGGSTNPSWDCILIDPINVRTSTSVTRTSAAQHELFHRIQYTYDKNEDTSIKEGTSVAMADQVFTDTDNDPKGMFANNYVKNYLADPDLARTNDAAESTGGGLLQAGHNAGLFYKYLAEQYGSSPATEPGYHSNALREMWESMVTLDGIPAIEDALANLGHSNVTFGDVFNDFILANYLKDYPGDPLYQYVDDNATDYGTVTPVDTVNLDRHTPLFDFNQSLFAWGAAYYQALVKANCDTVQVWGHQGDGSIVDWHVVAIDNQDQVRQVDSATTVPGEFLNYAYSNAAADLKSVTVIVGADAQDAEHDLSITCDTPSLDIISPHTINPLAYAGDPANPDQISVIVKVTSDDTLVEGLDGHAFNVTIGGKAATVLNSVYVQAEYWLTVLPPTQAAPNLYDLSVSLGAASDTEIQSVLYQPRPPTDQMMVLDSSGSMLDFDKITAAENAAAMNLDIARDNQDQFGIVSFSTASSVLLPLTPASLPAHVLGLLALSSLTPNGATCIGCGLDDAQNELDARGLSTNHPNIVLLSDGMENTPPYWDDMKSRILNAGTLVDTIFLGPPDNTLSGTAESLMQSIAAETGGTYNRVFLESEPGALRPDQSASPNAPMTHKIQPANSMANVYLQLHERATGFARLQDELGLLVSVGQQVTYTLNMEANLAEALLAVNVDKSNTTQLIVWRPNGTPVNPGDPDVIVSYQRPTHWVYRLRQPMPGMWRVRITNLVNDEVQHLVVLQGDSKLRMEIYREPYGQTTPPTTTHGVQGMPIRFIVNLTNQAPIRGAKVTAQIQGPAAGVSTTLQLYDDGRHADGQAHDGVYANLAHRTAAPGSYCAVVTALIPPQGSNTQRLARTCLYVEEGADTDGDLIPDQYELLYRFNPNSAADANGDADNDGLTNLQEFRAGTNPRNDDTDGGGENDQSEITHGRNPFDSSDDRIKPPSSLKVSPGNGLNTISFAREPSAAQYVLLRSTSFKGPFTVVSDTIAPTGLYTDTGLTNNLPYIYRMAALDGGGNRSRFSQKAGAVPRIETDPPDGDVVINGDAATTNSRQVTLTLSSSPDTVKMKISNHPAMANTTWQPFVPTLTWQLPVAPGDVMVYVLFQDAAGNVSEEPASDTITLNLARLYLPLIRR